MEQDKKSEKSRRAILESALDLFSSRGYRGTSIRDIAETFPDNLEEIAEILHRGMLKEQSFAPAAPVPLARPRRRAS